ncbi:DUF11 domain-containing protein [Coleofasciculus sp. FACHB-129]|uniref:DUF11 domain-containing protein n=1 Tax=Cyanophyceae TaxID=3028117 RepID=UPI001686024A|nr:DUF11 domain-containing protein [Coleofasciculus sp. FACHB-129]MBD1894608.1 DUF11 domain-containing protein [Coleofasciculus sp. FACHB-129]
MLKFYPHPPTNQTPFSCWSRLCGSLALAICAISAGSEVAYAEGSRELTNNPGNRPFLEYRNANFETTDIPRRTRIRVYANAGETIYLGSSAVGVGDGEIQYRPPNSNAFTSCGAGIGKIENRAQEEAGPLPVNPQGYSPCTITAAQTSSAGDGIWEIDFVSPDPQSDNNPYENSANAPQIQNSYSWTATDQLNDVPWVLAWDVTVANGNQPIPGRAYANYFSLNLGANGRSLRSKAFVLTDEGYQYQIDLNGLDPFGFIFFANNKGFTANPNGSPIYQSVPLIGSNVYNPDQPDFGTDVTYKIFFNQPSSTLPLQAPITPASGGQTWLLTPAVAPPTPTDFKFTGTEGTNGQAGTTTPLGGNFSFNTPASGSYQIILDLNQDKKYGTGNDRILVGTADVGINTVPWDGLDANGATIPPSNIAYGAQIVLSAGEIHFPFLDPESNPNGLKILRLNNPSPASNPAPPPDRVYYNDAPLVENPPPPEAPNPLSALAGISSSNGAHAFQGVGEEGFGNNRGIDTWTYYPSTLTNLEQGITISEADLQIQKTLVTSPVVAGSPVTYTLTVTNNGPSNVTGATVTDNVPSQITGVTWTCAITTGTGSCGQASGTGNAINTTVNLNSGAVATYTVTGAISPITPSGELSNTATVTRPKDVTDPNPNNNTSSTTTTIQPNPVTPTGIKSVRLVTDADASASVTTGDTVEFTITYVNNAPTSVTNFLASDSIDATKLSFVAGSYSFTASGTGTTVTQNPNYNGTIDPNLTNPTALGTLSGNGGRVVIKFQAIITAAAGVQISNQAVATSTGGTVNSSVTDAIQGNGDLPQIVDDGINQGNLANTGDDDPTVLTVASPGNGNLRLVKRITSVTRNGVLLSGINFNSFVDDPNSDNDNASGWSQLSPIGVSTIAAETALRSGDQVEYTIYFLSDGTAPANNVRFCDPIPTGTTFLPDSFGSGAGISVNRSGTIANRTNASDADEGTFLSPLAPLPAGNGCPNQNNADGAVTVNLGNISNATGSNYGFTRFRVKIN